MYLIVESITTIPRRLLAESAGHFWWSVEFENVANPDFKNLKNLQNHGHLSEGAKVNPWAAQAIF